MNPENLIPNITSIGGGFFIGVLLGYFIKKIIKILMFVAGGMVCLLLYLQQQQIISVNPERLEALSAFIFASISSSLEKVTLIGDTSYLGIPLVGGLSAGIAIGFMKG